VSNCLDGELERLIDHVLDEAGDGLHRSKKIGLSRDEIELILADARSRLVSDLHCRHGDWRNVVRAFDALIQQASEGRQR
jgi:hypothetical protein